MWYSIVAQDSKNSSELRQKARSAHIARLQELLNQGRLLVAGPNPAIDCNEPGSAGFTGSIIIAEFDSFEQAQSWATEDPYLDAGVYQSVEVKPFKKALP